jgi:hypothetical protein
MIEALECHSGTVAAVSRRVEEITRDSLAIAFAAVAVALVDGAAVTFAAGEIAGGDAFVIGFDVPAPFAEADRELADVLLQPVDMGRRNMTDQRLDRISPRSASGRG